MGKETKMTATIIRVEKGDEGSFGTVLLDGKAFCVSLELPDRVPYISPLPVGVYTCKRTLSPLVERITGGKRKDTFEITGYKGHNRILFHPGNTIEDTRLCVLLAQYYGKLREKRAVLNSGATFELFMEIMHGINEFELTIKEVV